MGFNTSVYDLNTGQKLDQIGGSPWREQGGLIFFTPDNTYPSSTEPEKLSILIWNPKKDIFAVQARDYLIPTRKGCGQISEDPYEHEISGPYLLARRADDCGPFVARVKWAQPSYTKPEILPLK